MISSFKSFHRLKSNLKMRKFVLEKKNLEIYLKKEVELLYYCSSNFFIKYNSI